MIEQVRQASWLEVFYDLIFAVAVTKAMQTLGHELQGHISAAIYVKYVLIMVPLWWAWSGHTLFANRFDTDDTLHRLLTLAQMAAALSLSLFISVDFDSRFHGFVLSYVTVRGLLIVMYARTAFRTDRTERSVARYLGIGFAIEALISLLSLACSGPWRFVVLFLGIGFDLLVPPSRRSLLKEVPVQGHHLPDRYASWILVVLGVSVSRLVATYETVGFSTHALTALASGFVLAAAIWWIYFDNFEDRIYGNELGTGQAVIYLHIILLIGLGGVASMIRFCHQPGPRLDGLQAADGSEHGDISDLLADPDADLSSTGALSGAAAADCHRHCSHRRGSPVCADHHDHTHGHDRYLRALRHRRCVASSASLITRLQGPVAHDIIICLASKL